ncbi:hypothetical protein BJ742DRAFT_793367 [Cladochytrium replicatum]|nr:hypothetical protein BJ742DRAFT_793367 [Cladochytrium replicatum]
MKNVHLPPPPSVSPPPGARAAAYHSEPSPLISRLASISVADLIEFRRGGSPPSTPSAFLDDEEPVYLSLPLSPGRAAKLNAGSQTRPVLSVRADEPIAEAVRKLVVFSVHSLVVELGEGNAKCVGLIDAGDIIAFLVRIAPQSCKHVEARKEDVRKRRREIVVYGGEQFRQSHDPEPALDQLMDDVGQILDDLQAFSEKMARELVGTVVDASGRDPYIPIQSNHSVVKLLDVFSRNVHRVPIIADYWQSETPVAIVSQSEVVAHIIQCHSDALAESGWLTRPIAAFWEWIILDEQHAQRSNLNEEESKEESRSPPSSPRRKGFVSIDSDRTVMEALVKLNETGVDALAIVDHNLGSRAHEVLVGNFSTSDIQGLFRDTIPSLLDPVASYLRRFSPSSLRPVTCSLFTPLGEILEMMTGPLAVSRVWIVDRDREPLGYVGLTELCRIFRTAI